ncbi:sensor histidine kinase [Flavobacterium procerum]|uniref:Sensor histidine kinase n=1 Tax=Flavobacterium procerum TaxID=1455569 RepID=A0ABV6BVT0_9FLAO
MSENKKIVIDWIYPAVWGTLMYNVLRAVTDLTHHGIFWEGEMKLHLTALLLSIFTCYLCNFVWRRRLYKTDEVNRMGRDYLFILAELLFWLNLLLIIGQAIGVLFMGSGWIDYMLINVIYLPLLLIFYTLIRNTITEKNANKKNLILEKLKVEKNEAELEFLKSQYHPHFLFNALNTIYFQVEDNNAEAKKSIEYLSELLRYQLYDVNQEVMFHQEINYLRSYIAFQQLRTTDKLKVNIDIDDALKEQRIHPLLFQPLLENAFKYVGGLYQIDFKLKLKEDQLYFELRNSVSDALVASAVKDSGIGLNNLKRRLELLYPGKHQLEICNYKDSFQVTLILSFK